MNIGIITGTLGLTALGLAVAHPAAAQTTVTIYNFDIQGNGSSDSSGGTDGFRSNTPYNGAGALAGAGTTWNVANSSNHVYSDKSGATYYGIYYKPYYSGNVIAGALNSHGGQSTVGFSEQADDLLTGNNDGVASNPDQLLSNYAYDGNTNSPYEISFTGLTPDAAFTVDLYSEDGGDSNDADGRGADFNETDSTYTTVISTVDVQNSGVSDTGFVKATPGPYVNADGSPNYAQNNSNYAQFSGTTDATGDLYFTYSDTQYSNNSAQFNGAQIAVDNPSAPSAAPEPSEYGVMAIVAVGLGGLMLRARRRAAVSAT